MDKIQFKYIGGLPSQKTFNRNSFVIEVTPEEWEKMKTFPYPQYFAAEVVESKNKGRFIGEYVKKFCNPYFEMHSTGWPVFVRIWE